MTTSAHAVVDDVGRLLAGGRLATGFAVACFIAFVCVATMGVRSVVDINGPTPAGTVISSYP